MALPVSYNVRSLLVRWKTSLLAMFGIGLVVTVFIVLLAMVSGFRLVLRATGLPDNGIVTQRGSNSELTSWLTKDNADVISVDGRVAREKDGQPMASCEMVVITALPRQNNGQLANVTVRGVTPKAFDVRGGLNFVQGRNFTPGLDEIIVGKQIQQRVKGLDLGSKVRMQNRDWTVVGIFAADGNSFESEIWGDYNVMGPAFMRQGGCESLTVRLTSAAVISGFDKDLRANPQMQVKLDPERKYYEDQAGPVAGPLLALAGFVSIVMGIGAVFGAMNTMYAIVSARTREVGTLRALGFSRFSILSSFVLESVFLALVGGLLGCLLAIPANGFSTATGQTASFSEIAFAFRITSVDLLAGLVFALVMGIFGGLLPAFRAARLPITSALREA